MVHPSLLPSPLAIGPQHLEKLTVQSAMGSRHDPRHYCRQLASTDVWETTLMQPPDDRCSQLARPANADRRPAGPPTEVDLPRRRSEWHGSF